MTSAEIEEKTSTNSFFRSSLVVPPELRITRSCPAGDHTILAQRVLGFLREQGWTDVPTRLEDQIAWPAQVCPENRLLEPIAAHWDGAQKMLVARLRSAGLSNDVLLTIKMRNPLGVPRDTGAVRANASTPRGNVRNSKLFPLLVRSGDRATLLFDQGPVHLSLPVICLQSGRAQESIRVREVGQRRVVRAIVVSTAQLRATGQFEVN